MAKKASLKDIANNVGVSTALVSYVLNGLEKEKRVGKEIADKIREAANKLNYQPNQIARSLRKGSTNTIGLIVADISNIFFGQLARIIEDEANKHNYIVIFGSSDESCAKSELLVETFLNRQVDGFIIVPSAGCENQLKSLIKKEIPFVLFDRYFTQLPTSYVMLDNQAATYDAVSHLLKRGVKNIMMVAYDTPLFHMKERVEGYRIAIEENNLKDRIDIKLVNYNKINEELDTIVQESVVEGNTEAMVFATNALCVGALYAIRKRNIKVPEQVALVGFDGSEAFDFYDPPVTCIKQPLEEMGKESVRLLIDQINGTNRSTVQLKLKHRLIERASSK